MDINTTSNETDDRESQLRNDPEYTEWLNMLDAQTTGAQ